MIKTCLACASEYSTEDKRRKYCGAACYHKKASAHPNKGAFGAHSVPWNKNRKGLHLSIASEFKRGRAPLVPVAPIGALRVRKDKNGTKRAWVKVAQPNNWRLRAVVSFEAVNGPILTGLVIHHVDRDALNDDPSNLKALTRAQHLVEHLRDVRHGQRGLFEVGT